MGLGYSDALEAFVGGTVLEFVMAMYKLQLQIGES